MLEKVELIKSNGDVVNVDLISEFSVEVEGAPKKFVLMTANEIDQNGLVKILASELKEGKLIKIESDDDWTLVKNVMRSIISSSNGDFTYTNTSDNMSFEVSDDYARVIAVQDSAKQALVKDYDEKKPIPEDVENPSTETKKNPNAGIYPTESETVPIGSEVVPGIAEMSENTEEETEESAEEVTKEEEGEPQDIVPNPDAVIPEVPSAVEEVPAATDEAPVAVESVVPSSNDSARDELVNSIIAAVDKYIASSSNNGNSDMQNTIAKMQEELNKMAASLKTQE